MNTTEQHYDTQGDASHLQSCYGRVAILSQSDAHIVQEDAGTAEVTSSAKKRTPGHIEECLRRYNKEGVTKWDDILLRLKNEGPSFEIKRSTLGEYLKECNLGTSRKKTMVDDEMKQIVLTELNKPRSRKRGVRKVWQNLKSDGHHIKRDFVEKFMKDLDPDGFTERRPKWKTLLTTPIALASDPAAPPLALPAKSFRDSLSSPDHASPSLSINGAFGTTEGMTQPHCSLVSFRSTESMHGEVPSHPLFVSTNPALSTHHAEHVSTLEESFMEESATETTSFVPPRNEDARSRAEIRREDEELDIETGQEMGQDSLLDDDSFVSSSRTEPSDRVIWDAVSGANNGEQRTQIQRLHLQNTIDDLLVQLDNWGATSPHDADSDMSMTSNFPTSATRDTFIDTVERLDGDYEAQYIPEHKVSETQLTNDILSMALTLSRILSRSESSQTIIEVVDRLRGILGGLQDIRFPPEVLQNVGLRYSRVANIVLHSLPADAEQRLPFISTSAAVTSKATWDKLLPFSGGSTSFTRSICRGDLFDRGQDVHTSRPFDNLHLHPHTAAGGVCSGPDNPRVHPYSVSEGAFARPSGGDMYDAAGAGPDTPNLNTKNPPRKLIMTGITHDVSSVRRKNNPGFVCPVSGCGSTFTRSFNLKGHLRSHNVERPFKCGWPGCEKGFARQHDCRRHEALHINIRPYTCAGCKKTFARMDALNCHRVAGCAQHEQPLHNMDNPNGEGGR